MYEVYCHFGSEGAWTLVQSYSFKRKDEFDKPLCENQPVGEDALKWSGYRLRKSRMKSVKSNSTLLQFTCDYEKHHRINTTDYLQIRLRKITKNNKTFDFLENDGIIPPITIGPRHGKIGDFLNHTQCQVELDLSKNFLVRVYFNPECHQLLPCPAHEEEWFGRYAESKDVDCFRREHRCVQNNDSMTQLWFGKRAIN